MLCRGDRFVEGIVDEDLVPHAVERMLVDATLWKALKLKDASKAAMAGDVTPQTQADAKRFAALRAAFATRSFREETI